MLGVGWCPTTTQVNLCQLLLRPLHHEESLRQRRGILWSLLDDSAPHGIMEEDPFLVKNASYPPNMGSTGHLSPLSPVPVGSIHRMCRRAQPWPVGSIVGQICVGAIISFTLGLKLCSGFCPNSFISFHLPGLAQGRSYQSLLVAGLGSNSDFSRTS